MRKILKNSYEKLNHGFLKECTQNRLLTTKSEINNKNGVPFVGTYHSQLKCLSKIIKDNLYLLYMNDEIKKTFTPLPLI